MPSVIPRLRDEALIAAELMAAELAAAAGRGEVAGLWLRMPCGVKAGTGGRGLPGEGTTVLLPATDPSLSFSPSLLAPPPKESSSLPLLSSPPSPERRTRFFLDPPFTDCTKPSTVRTALWGILAATSLQPTSCMVLSTKARS